MNNSVSGLHRLAFSIRVFLLFSVYLCLPIPKAWSQGLQPVNPISQFSPTQVRSSSQQNIQLKVIGSPISITSFSFANSQGGVAEFIAGTTNGCVVDGSTMNAVGTVCTVPVTFQPAYPGPRLVPLKAVTSGGTFYFGLDGIGLAAQVSLTPGDLSTLAGTGVSGNTGNNGAATAATLSHPARTAVDYQGNVFVADAGNNVIREIVASTGNIVLVAGTGTACATPLAACGDGGVATNANLLNPSSVAVDATGNLFIADSGDNRVRRVDAATGTITTVAGNGIAAYAGDSGQATAASMGNPQQVVVDYAGNLYIADAGDNAVRFVSASSGVITTLAGDGTICSPSTAVCGDGGAAGGGSSKLNAPSGLALDSLGNLYIADTGDNRIRRVDASTGNISTVAGTGTAGYAGDGAAATSAELSGPMGVDVDAGGDIYVSDTGNASIRLITSLPVSGNYIAAIVTIAGSGAPCSAATATCGDGGTSTGANLIRPQDAALDSYGNLYIADRGANRIRKVYVVEPTLTFDPAIVTTTSPSNPESILVANIGNEISTASVPVSGTNPTFSAGFSYDNQSSVCPLLTPSSSPAYLPPGYGCSYGINFQPEMTGTTMGSMVLTGDALNVANASQTVLLTGNGLQIMEGNSLSSSNTVPAYGDPVTFTDTIPPVNGISPTGTVNLYLGATLIGTASVGSSGISTFVIDSLPVGTDNILAVYSGDANFESSISNGVVEMVGNPATIATTTTLASSLNPSNYGQTTNLTATVGYPSSGAVPTGSVTFYSPGANTTINLQATSASTTTSQTLNLAAGTYSVSVLGNSGGGLYAGWNSASNPGTNNLWTDRYGIELCATCTALVNDTAGDPGYATDMAALAAFQTAKSLNLTVDVMEQGQAVGNPYTFTLTSPQSVSFYVPDGAFSNGAFTDTSSFADDTGGLSLLLTPLTTVGTANVNASGVATLSISTLAIGSDAIQAVYSGDNTYVGSSSAILTQTVNKAAENGTLTTSNATPVVGQAVTFTDTFTAVNSIYPSGTISFYNGTTSIGTGTLTNGVATLMTSALPPGTDTIAAVYGGNANFQAATSNAVVETVSKAMGPNTLTASNYSPNLGQAVMFTDKIQIVDGITPTGMVNFYSGSTLIGTSTLTGSGVATLTTMSLPAGSNTITSVYSGDGNYDAATSNAVTVIVAKGNATNTLTASTTTSVVGQAVTFTATLAGVAGFTPTGMVTFYNGTTAIGTGAVNASGIASVTTSSLPVGNDSITAAYGGDANYPSSTSNAIVEMVSKATGPDTLTASTYSATLGQAVTLTDTIQTVDSITPTGTVSIYNGTTLLGMGTLNGSGVATLTIALPPGNDVITAAYSGDGDYASESSNAVTVIVAKGSATNTLTASTTSTISGQPVTFTATLAGVSGFTPTGTVIFYNGTTALGMGTVNASGIATLATTTLPVGSDSVTAVYSGDANYGTSTSGTVVVMVAPLLVATVDVLTASTTASVFGESVTFTDTITGSRGAPTGTVTFYDGTVAIGTATVGAGGVAAVSTTTLSVGSHSVTAVYSGDVNYLTGTSNAVTVTVGDGDFAIAVSPSYQIINNGQSAIYMVSLTGAGAPFDELVTLSATGLPTGATVSFSPASVIPGAGPTTVIMTVATSSAQASVIHTHQLRGIGYAVLLLPLLGWRRFRSRLRRSAVLGLVLLAAVAGLGGATLLTGCGGGTFTKNYTITVTGNAGADGHIQHATVVRLGVQSFVE